MREKSVELGLCDKIDRRATDIYTACSFQDITGQRTARVVRTLRFVEQRINAVIAAWGTDRISGEVDDIAAKMETLMDAASGDDEHLLNGPQGMGGGLKQDEVDRMLTGRAGLESPPEALSQPASGQVRGFAPPDPLVFTELDPAKRAALFG
jgi:hypothetical protein